MKLAYGTYGMPDVEPARALEAIAAAGFQGVELAVADRYPTAPARLTQGARAALRRQLEAHGLDLVATLLLLDVMGEESAHAARLQTVRDALELGLGLAHSGRPPATFTMGGKSADWERERDGLVRRLAALGDVAAEMGCQLAVEPHVGGLVDRPERAVWLMRTLDHPHVRLNFDISHFALAGYGLADTVPVLLPWAVHAHVKDSRWDGDAFTFLLPGEGDFDYPAYFSAMARHGWSGHVTVEVSAMVSRRPGYDPLAAVTYCHGVLTAALAAAQPSHTAHTPRAAIPTPHV